MAIVIEIPCPGCDRIIKVPESAFGKKIKCKHCGEKIEVEEVDPDDLDDEEDEEDEPKPKKKSSAGKVDKPSKVNASKPGGGVKAKKEEPKPEAPPAPAAPYKFADDDDEGDGGATPNPLGVIDEGEDIPRCPHCAKELDPPDAVVCVHCGFNNMTRTKAESKKTWAPGAEDWFHHLLPGVLALIGCILLITLDIITYRDMEEWLADTPFEKEKANPQMGILKPTFYARINDAFTMFIFAASVMPIIKLARFAIIRLAIDNKPEEKVKA